MLNRAIGFRYPSIRTNLSWALALILCLTLSTNCWAFDSGWYVSTESTHDTTATPSESSKLLNLRNSADAYLIVRAEDKMCCKTFNGPPPSSLLNRSDVYTLLSPQKHKDVLVVQVVAKEFTGLENDEPLHLKRAQTNYINVKPFADSLGYNRTLVIASIERKGKPGWYVLADTYKTSPASHIQAETNLEKFSQECTALEQQYSAPEVDKFFQKAQRNLEGYFTAILMQRVASEHSYPCVFRYREALEDAKNHNWNSSKVKIEEAKKESKDLHQHACVADIWIASSLINRAMGNHQEALSDLRLVYDTRKANPQGWTENSDIFHIPPYVRFPE